MDVKELIPQRDPFLFLDQIIDYTESNLVAEVRFHSERDFFKGHFPGNPVVPGVILTEACFQSGAALIALKNQGAVGENNLAVVSRIQSAKFKNLVGPNEKLTIKTEIVEQLANAAYFKTQLLNEANKKVLLIEFACTLIQE